MHSQEEHSRYFFILITLVAALSGILFGFDTGVISGAILFINQEFSLTPLANGIIVSAVLFGAFIGALCSGRLVDYLGRKKLLIADAVIFIIGTLASTFAPHIYLLIVARISVGIAIGIASYVAPLYISEIAPPQHRGALVSLNQLAITCGILLSYIIDYFFVVSGAWREMFAVGVLPACLLLLGMYFLPESPRFICSKNNFEQAFLVLKKIHGAHKAKEELKQIQQTLNKDSITLSMLFDPFIRSAMIIGMGLACIQQVTGINTILYYAPTIFNMAGFVGPANAILATIGIGVVLFSSTFFVLPFIDTLGRRPLLLLGLAGMMLSLFFLSFIFSNHQLFHFEKWLALGSMLFYILSFSISLGPIMWLMIAEIYPLKVRGLASSLATAVNWSSNMLVALTFLSLLKWLGGSETFFVYGVLSFLSIVFVYFCVPETKAITLEQIETNLRKGLRYRQLSQKEESCI